MLRCFNIDSFSVKMIEGCNKIEKFNPPFQISVQKQAKNLYSGTFSVTNILTRIVLILILVLVPKSEIEDNKSRSCLDAGD